MPTLLWYPDVPQMPGWLEALVPEFRFFFCVSREMASEAGRRFPGVACHWLSQGPRFHEFRAPVRKRKFSDLGFIGNLNGPLYAERRRMLAELLASGDYDLRIWGPRPEASLMSGEEHRLLLPRHAGASVYGRRFKDVALNTSIIIGHDACGDLAGYTSAKTYMVLGCGGFYLAKRASFLEEAFTPGVEMETFGDLAELRHKISRYLGDEALRRRVAVQGRDKVLSQYTYAHRMEEMLEAAGLWSAGTDR
jgi:spore maturation protein CgeB